MKRIVATLAILFTCLSIQTSHAFTYSQITRFVFVGDSIVQGTTASRSTRSLTHRIESIRPDWFVHNYGVAGSSVSGGGPWPPVNVSGAVSLLGQVYVLMLGTNDWGFGIPLDEFRMNYSNVLMTLGFLHPEIICVTPIWRGQESQLNAAGNTLEEYRQAIREECAFFNHPIIEGEPLVPNDPKYFDFYVLHPNDFGYARYARNLARALKPYIDDPVMRSARAIDQGPY